MLILDFQFFNLFPSLFQDREPEAGDDDTPNLSQPRDARALELAKRLHAFLQRNHGSVTTHVSLP